MFAARVSRFHMIFQFVPEFNEKIPKINYSQDSTKLNAKKKYIYEETTHTLNGNYRCNTRTLS